MTQQHETAPKVWRGRFFEDFDVGDVFRSRLGRTMTEVDNIWFTTLTMNTNQMHFNTALRGDDAVRQTADELVPHPRGDLRAVGPRYQRERHRESLVDRHQDPGTGVRRRHALRGVRDPVAA